MSISQVILQLKVYGVDRLEEFPFVTRPGSAALENALEELLLLEALDKVNGSIMMSGSCQTIASSILMVIACIAGPLHIFPPFVYWFIVGAKLLYSRRRLG